MKLSWLQQWSHRFFSTRRRGACRPSASPTARPRLEQLQVERLEERITPAYNNAFSGIFSGNDVFFFDDAAGTIDNNLTLSVDPTGNLRHNLAIGGAGNYASPIDLDPNTGGVQSLLVTTINSLTINTGTGTDTVRINRCSLVPGASLTASISVSADGGDSLVIDDTVAATGVSYALSITGAVNQRLTSSAFQPVDFIGGATGISSVQFLTGLFNDTLNVQAILPGVNYSMNTNGGNDSISVQSTNAGSLTIDASDGDDTINVGDATNTLNLFTPGGIPSITGGAGTDTVTVNDQGSTAALSYQLDTNNVTLSRVLRNDNRGVFYDDSVENLVLNTAGGGAGVPHTIQVLNTLSVTPITINAGIASNTIQVFANNIPVTINCGLGADTVQVGAAGNLNNILGPVAVNGNDATDSLTVFDNIGTVNSAYFVSANSITHGSTSIAYSDTFNSVTLNTSSSFPESTTVASTSATVASTIILGGGNADAMTVGNAANTLDDIRGPLFINGGNGNDSAALVDTGETTGNSFTINGQSIVRSGAALINVHPSTESLTLNAGSGGDLFTIPSTASPIAYTLDGGGGDDAFSFPTMDGLYAGFPSLTVIGGIGNDTISVDDQTAIFNGSYSIGALNATAMFVNRSDNRFVIYDRSFEHLVLNTETDVAHSTTVTGTLGIGPDITINAGPQNDLLQVNATNLPVTLNGGAGNDTLNVVANNAPITISGGDDNDTIVVGANSFNLDVNVSPITIHGDAGGIDSLTVLDINGTVSTPYIVTDSTVSHGTTYVAYDTVEFLQVSTTNNQSNTVNILSTSAAVNANGGTLINGLNNNDNFNVGNNGSLDDIQGLLSIAGFGGLNTLTLSDQNAPTGHTYTLTNNNLVRSGAANISYATIQNLNLNTSGGDDTITVQSTAGGVSTQVNAGAGDDVITFQTMDSLAPGMSLVGGAGNDVINVNDQTSAYNGPYVNNVDSATQSSVVRSTDSRFFFYDTTFENLILNLPTNTGHLATVTGTPGVGAAITFNGGPQNDTLQVFATNVPVTLNGNNGNDVINIQANSAPVAANGGDGNDTIVVGSSSTLDSIVGPVTASGGLGLFDTLQVRDDNGTVGAPYNIASSLVSHGTSFITYDAGIELVQVVARTNVSDTFFIQSTSPAAINGTFAFDFGGANDTYNIGNNGSLDSIQGGFLEVVDSGGSDTVNLSDQNNATGHTYTLTNNTLERDGVARFFYFGLETWNLATGGGNDTINVQSTQAGSTYNLNAGGGNDTINFPTMDALAPSVTLVGGVGNDVINVNEQASSYSGGYNLSASSATLAFVFRPADGRFFFYDTTFEALIVNLPTNAGHTASVFSTLGVGPAITLNGGSSNDTLEVFGSNLPITLNGGPGNDAFRIAGNNAPIAIDGGGGSDFFLIGSNNILDNVAAPITVAGGDGLNDFLAMSDSGGSGFGPYTITSSLLTHNLTAITYDSNVESVSVDSRSNLPDIINIVSTSATAVNGTFINDLGVLDDFYNVGNNGSLNNIQGSLSIFDAGGADTLNLNDQNNRAGHVYTLTSTSLTRDGMAGVFCFGNLETWNLSTGGGDDTINVQSTLTGSTYTLNAGGGNDTFNLGNAAASLDDLAGTLSLIGGGGNDPVNVNDQGDATNNAYTLNAVSLARTAIPILTLNTTEALTINAGTGNDFFLVQSTATASPVTIFGNSGDDLTSVIDVSQTIDNILGAVTFDGGPDTGVSFADVLAVADTGNPAASVYTVTASTIARLSAGTVTYLNTETVQVEAGNGADTLNVLSTSPNVIFGTTIVGRGGNDTVNIGNAANSLDDIRGFVSLIDLANGTDTVNLNDQGDPDANSYILNDATFSRAGSADILFNDPETARLRAGGNNDTVTVLATNNTTTWTLQGNGGTDTIVSTLNADFTLSNTGLSATAGLATPVALAGFEVANLTTITNGHTFTVSGWSGAGSLSGTGGTDAVLSTNDANFTLTNTSLAVSGGAAFTLSSIELATLTGGISNNTFTVSQWNGTATLSGGDGDDTYNLALLSAGTLNLIENPNQGGDTANITGNNSSETFAISPAVVTRGSAVVIFTADLDFLTVDGLGGNDAFTVTPSATTDMTILGGAPVVPPGDTLTLVLAGVTTPTLTLTVPAVSMSGDWTFGNRLPVHFSSIETLGNLIVISGRSFNDLNGDGTDNGGTDPGQSNVTVNLFRDVNNNNVLDVGDGAALATQPTGAGGDYSFTSLFPGRYFVQEVVPSGAVQTAPSAPGYLTVNGTFAGTPYTGNDFGIFQLVAFSGRTFTDANGDGDGTGDPALGGVTVQLFRDNGNALFDGGDPLVASQITPSGTGAFNFTGVGPGSYFLREVVPNGYVQTTDDPVMLTALSGTNVGDLSFGNQPTQANNNNGGNNGGAGGSSGSGGSSSSNVASAGGTVQFFATGADAGGLPEVKVFNPNGSLQFDFFAYTAAFRGGVRVAVGDVNGDGTSDIITAPGAGGGPLVQVFSGKDLSLLVAFNAYATGFLNGLFVAAGDVNHDGRDDIITGPDAGGGPLVQVFSGKDVSLLYSFNAYNPLFLNGVRVAAGDTNGDGYADLITAPSAGGGPLVEVFSGRDGSLLLAFNAYDPSFRGGVYVAAGDLNGDGKAEIITGPGLGGGPLVEVFDGSSAHQLLAFNVDNTSAQGGVRVGSVDADGNGKADILVGAGPGNGPLVTILDGLSLALLDQFFAYDPLFTGGVYVGG